MNNKYEHQKYEKEYMKTRYVNNFTRHTCFISLSSFLKLLRGRFVRRGRL